MSEQPPTSESAKQNTPIPVETPKAEASAKVETPQPAIAPQPGSPTIPQPAEATPSLPPAMPPIENLYQFGLTDADRDRLIAQTLIFSQYLRDTMRKTLPKFEPQKILDLGCGEGQITRTLADIYYKAHVVGADKDANAIQKATAEQAKYIADNPIDFVVADAEEKLPDGKFDLIYESLALMYVKDVEKALKLMFDSLEPGGYVWLKESHPDWATAFKNNALYTRYASLTFTAFFRIGGHNFLATELPQMLPRVGFTNVQYLEERYLLDYNSMSGRIGISIVLGVLYNLRKLVSRMEQIPEEQLLDMHRQMRDHADTIRGTWIHGNVIAQKPKA